jgi:hypothetical protein
VLLVRRNYGKGEWRMASGESGRGLMVSGGVERK